MASLSHILQDPLPDSQPVLTTTSSSKPVISSTPETGKMASKKQRRELDDDVSAASASTTASASTAAAPAPATAAATTPKPDSSRADDPDEQVAASATASTRRSASGATSAVYSGNKMRHLKKEDGIPLWRADIQYEFLKLVFSDTTKCFTKHSDGSKGHTFAEVYIDAMAKSSKCSRILKEKLLQDREGAASMAMVCLLVNLGRMNTTLNFFPEMRAQLRTYHSIPALQAHQDPSTYKQLQDAPRLKSILKGATEDEPQPSTIEDIRAASIPRTNPVNLIFVMSQYALKVSEIHFPPPRDFFDLIMRPSLSSASRANAFLWLIWWYMESDFSYEDSQRNPFGPGKYGEDEEGSGAVPVKVPTLEALTEEQAEVENIDTEEEKHFGEVKRKERIAILASEPSPAMTALKRARKEKGLSTGHNAHPSDDEGSEAGYQKGGFSNSIGRSALHETESAYTRSPSPVASRGFQAVNGKPPGDMQINHLLNTEELGMDQTPTHAATASAAPLVKKGPGRGNWRRHKKADASSAAGARSDHVPLLPNTGQISFVNEGLPMQIATPGGNKGAAGAGISPNQITSISFQAPVTRDHVPTPSYQAQKRHRGITQHQSAVINHRKMQIEYLLDKRIRKAQSQARRKREDESTILRAWKRIRYMGPEYDSEEEATKGKENEGYSVDVNAWRRSRVLYAGFVRANNEPTDVGEDSKSMAQAFRRCSRRLERWSETAYPGQAMIRRNTVEQNGGRKLQRNGLSTGRNGVALANGKSRSRSYGARRRGVSKGRARRRNVEAEESGGGSVSRAELDEEDREILGEVDADESEEEDEEEEEGGEDDEDEEDEEMEN